MKKIGASACLCNIKCRYDGSSIANLGFDDYLPICPEVLIGLPAPRQPLEIQGTIITNTYDDLAAGQIKVVDNSGKDYSNLLVEGCNKALEQILSKDITRVVLKDNSPTCGLDNIYDGSFSGKRIKGEGIFCALLRKNNIEVINWDNKRD